MATMVQERPVATKAKQQKNDEGEPAEKIVRIDRDLAKMAEFVCLRRGGTVSRYLSLKLRNGGPSVVQDYDDETGKQFREIRDKK